MKLLGAVIIFLAIIWASCGSAGTKADTSEINIETITDTTAADTKNPKENIPINKTKIDQSNQARAALPSTEPAEILAKIDSYLASAAQYTVQPSGGIVNCSVTVTNNLPDVTFQKALVEVSILNNDGSVIKTDYYTIINIEPGMSKVFKVPNSTHGSKIATSITKVKSSELTKGEWVLSGKHFVSN